MLIAATASASSLTSVASTCAAGMASALAIAMQPDPVPMSRMRRIFSGAIHGWNCASMSSAIGERGTSTRSST